MRLAAPDSRIGQVKDEQDNAAQSMPDATPAKNAQAQTALQIKPEADAVDIAMPQAHSSDSELVSEGMQPQGPAAVASEADLLAVKQEQPAMHAPDHPQTNHLTAPSASEPPAQALPVSQQQAANVPTLPTAAILKRVETLVEDDDYDADD